MDNDLDLDFQGHMISYSLAIFKGVKGANVEHNIFCAYKIYSFERFSHVNLLSISIQREFRKKYVLGQNLTKMTLK